jgi:hypothetical protein
MDRADLQSEIDSPFQSLVFLVRNWSNFRDGDSEEECDEMMATHLKRFVNPARRATLRKMFKKIEGWCLPHPGLKIQKETWTGDVSDIGEDFVRFTHRFITSVFSQDLTPKKILGTDLSTTTFTNVVKTFVDAFHEAAPQTGSFSDAMSYCSTMLAKDNADNEYKRYMTRAMSRSPSGLLTEREFMEEHLLACNHIEDQFGKTPIFGNEEIVERCRTEIQDRLILLMDYYSQLNMRTLERALAKHSNMVLVAVVLCFLDWVDVDERIDERIDVIWLDATIHFRIAYSFILCYMCWLVSQLQASQGKLEVVRSITELGMDMTRKVVCMKEKVVAFGKFLTDPMRLVSGSCRKLTCCVGLGRTYFAPDASHDPLKKNQ